MVALQVSAFAASNTILTLVRWTSFDVVWKYPLSLVVSSVGHDPARGTPWLEGSSRVRPWLERTQADSSRQDAEHARVAKIFEYA